MDRRYLREGKGGIDAKGENLIRETSGDGDRGSLTSRDQGERCKRIASDRFASAICQIMPTSTTLSVSGGARVACQACRGRLGKWRWFGGTLRSRWAGVASRRRPEVQFAGNEWYEACEGIAALEIARGGHDKVTRSKEIGEPDARNATIQFGQSAGGSEKRKMEGQEWRLFGSEVDQFVKAPSV